MANDPSRQEQVRSELANAASALLLGPLDPEEVIESAPVDTYLTGILWPRGAPVDGVDDDAGLDSGSDPASGVETAVPGYRAIRPCSVGITFAVAKDATVTISLGETARYVPVEIERTAVANEPATGHGAHPPEAPVSKSGQARKAWARRRLGYSVELPHDTVSGTIRISDFIDVRGATVV